MTVLENISLKAIWQSVEVIKRFSNPGLVKKNRYQYLVHLYSSNVYYQYNFYVWNEEVNRALCILSAFSEIVNGGSDFFGLLNASGGLNGPGETNSEATESIAKVYKVLKAFKSLRLKNH